jgi:hypothetical protein
MLTSFAACAPQPAEPPADEAAVPPSEIAPYVDFLAADLTNPVDYLLDLFETRDLVILCERWHPEATQYELIWELVRDPRFVDRVGRIYTELGARNLQADLDFLLTSPDLDESEARELLLSIYRDLGIHPGWDHTNFFDFLFQVQGLNRELEPERQVEVRFLDVELGWDGLSREAYQEFREQTLPERDRLMADAAIEAIRAADEADGQPAKALVILNYRHAFNDFSFADGSKGDNTGRYLFEELPGRVANVMLNTVALLPGTTDREAVFAPIQQGRWDAAFRFAGIEEAAFDFPASPFGRDSFDYFSFRPHSVTYQDVFTVFVFWRPLDEHRMVSGIPGLFDGFEEELRRRLEVVGADISEQDLDSLLAASVEPVSEPYDELERLEGAIAGWLEPAH